MIKPVTQLQCGDLVFFREQQWQCSVRGSGYKLLWPLDNTGSPIAIYPENGPVAVYGHRDSFDHIPF